MLWVLIRIASAYQQHLFLWRNKQNYPLIIIKYMYPPYLFHFLHTQSVKSQISLGICPVWSEYLLSAHWVPKVPRFLHGYREDSDQTGRMPSLIWVFAGRTGHFVTFVMLWLFLIHAFWNSLICNEKEKNFYRPTDPFFLYGRVRGNQDIFKGGPV